MCDNPLKSNGNKCTVANLIVFLPGYGTYMKLENGQTTQKDIDDYVLGTSASDLTKDSNIKKVIDKFYEENYAGKSEYEELLDKKVTFCNDQTYTTTNTADSLSRSSYVWNPYSTYTQRNRVGSDDYNTCGSRSDMFLYSTKDADEGNKKLKYPIGLLTRAEVEVTGYRDKVNFSNYLINMGMTMTPSMELAGSQNKQSISRGFHINANQLTYEYDTRASVNVRPVISFKMSNKIISGDGSRTNPFVFGKGE